MRYEAALFDLDGTLVDSSADIIAAVRHACEHVGANEPPEGQDILLEIGKPLEEVFRDLGSPGGPGRVGAFIRAFREFYAGHFNDHATLYPDVPEVLEELAGSGVATGVVTTKMQEQAEMVVRAAGLSRLFGVVRGWREGLEHKPDAGPVRAALAALGKAPRRTLMVGDSELDILAGRAAGTDTCAVAYGFRPAPFLMSFHPDFLVSRFRDIGPIVLGRAAVK